MRVALLFIPVLFVFACKQNQHDSENTNKLKTNDTTLHEQKGLTSKDEESGSQPIILKENSINDFKLPFAEKEVLDELKKYYKSYTLERKIGQQDGPDYEYISLSKTGRNLVFFKFNWENKYLLDEIRITGTGVRDEYGIQVGSLYAFVKQNRKGAWKNSTDYHQHTYLYTDSSNIYYEITGDFEITPEMLDNLEDMVLTEEQLEKAKVQSIIWRKRQE